MNNLPAVQVLTYDEVVKRQAEKEKASSAPEAQRISFGPAPKSEQKQLPMLVDDTTLELTPSILRTPDENYRCVTGKVVREIVNDVNTWLSFTVKHTTEEVINTYIDVACNYLKIALPDEYVKKAYEAITYQLKRLELIPK
jgi:hypothetical protein